MSEVDIFKSYLLAKGLELNPPATPKDIELFELFWEIRLPEDLKEYFLKINGFDDRLDGLTYLWSLWEVDTITEYYGIPYMKGLTEAEKYYIFADYNIEGQHWTIRLSDDDNHPIFLIAGYSEYQVANNFTDFIERYRKEEPESLF